MPVPRVVRCAKEFELAGDGRSFAPAETDLDPLAQWVFAAARTLIIASFSGSASNYAVEENGVI
jgi:hypothetical protein